MSDDDLQITHLVVPKQWMVAVIGACMSALLTAGGTFYKYGQMSGRLTELEKRCPTPAVTAASRPEAWQEPH